MQQSTNDDERLWLHDDGNTDNDKDNETIMTALLLISNIKIYEQRQRGTIYYYE